MKGMVQWAVRKVTETFSYNILFPKSTNEHNTSQDPSRCLSKLKGISKRLTAVEIPSSDEESMDISNGYVAAGDNSIVPIDDLGGPRIANSKEDYRIGTEGNVVCGRITHYFCYTGLQ